MTTFRTSLIHTFRRFLIPIFTNNSFVVYRYISNISFTFNRIDLHYKQGELIKNNLQKYSKYVGNCIYKMKA